MINKGSALREGWEIRRLGDVYDVRDGTHDSPRYIEEGYPLITSKNLKQDTLNYNKVKYISHIDYVNINKRSKVDVGDILFAMIGTIGNPIVIKNEPDFAIKNVALFKVSDNQNSHFLKYFLDSEQVIKKMLRDAKGTTQKFVGLGYLRNFEIVLPPLQEQEKIVAILDEAFLAIAKAKENAELNLQNAKELFESYLQGVFENKGEGWEEKTLGELANVKSGGTPSRSKKEYWEGNIAWYSSGELNELFTVKPKRYINNLAIKNSTAKLFPQGSLLIGMYDTAALKMSIIDRDATFNQAIAGVHPNKDIDLIFILNSINSIKPEILSLRRGVRQKNLNLTKIKNIPIFLPIIKTQQKIVKKLNTLQEQTKKLESIYTKKLQDLEELKKSILQKAFNGELT
ncbi:restriction endonuclease subunit S [Sulfurimonas sp.]|uniref:restriction endonuclease subunit S n=1 Tax=Sulfurimonas sp. TaxID=2022749 RepID=UPI002AB1A6B4|nr:restriction endonuclease subunit S [Sulfurimonas sp.]